MKNTRNYGIDLLRVLAMLFIIICHIMRHGGALDAVSINEEAQFAVIWLIESFVFCGVNCFALISGYVGYRNDDFELKLIGIIKLWLQVFFWGIVILLLEYFMYPDNITLGKIMKVALPVSCGEHWYFSAYFCLFFVRPLLNKIVYYSKKDSFYLIASILVLFSCYSTFAARFSDPLNLNWGRSFLWLVCLYLLGAWLNKLEMVKKCKNRVLICVIILSLLLTWLIKLILSFGISSILGEVSISLGNLFIINLSPTILAIAICLLLLFAKIEENKYIGILATRLSPVAFGVYIIHENGFLKKVFLMNKYEFLATISSWKILIIVIGSALLIYVICAIMEWIRIYIFKFCKIDEFAGFIERKCYLIAKRIKQCILRDA